jgi:hypothetical protein
MAIFPFDRDVPQMVRGDRATIRFVAIKANGSTHDVSGTDTILQTLRDCLNSEAGDGPLSTKPENISMQRFVHSRAIPPIMRCNSCREGPNWSMPN